MKEISYTPAYFLNDHQDTIVWAEAPALDVSDLGLLPDKSDLLV